MLDENLQEKRRCCRFPSNMAKRDPSTCDFPEFSSKWRTRFSHLRGGSYNHTVVQILIVMPAGAPKRRVVGADIDAYKDKVRNVANAGIFDHDALRQVISDRIKTWNLAQLPELSNSIVT